MILSMSREAVALFSGLFSRRLGCGDYLHQDMNLDSLCGCLCIWEFIRLKG